MADEIRYQYDDNFPGGSFSLANFRATLRALHEQDLMPLRPRAKRILDGMEYSTDASAQAEYSGVGVTITKEGTIKQEGSFSLKAVTDATANRSFSRAFSINLSAFQKITLWERSSGVSQTIRFYVQDGSGNQSYWNITTNGTANTWQQDTLTLSTPSGNNGANANLSNITVYGFQNLSASTTYYFDTIKAIVDMTVAILGTDLGAYYRHVYLTNQPLQVNAQAASTITAPAGNPRIDILTIDSAGALSWIMGTEASSPSAPWSSMPANKIPICLVYQKTTMTKVLDFEDKDTDTNQGYILADVRPFMKNGFTFFKGADVASASTVNLGNDGNFFNITGTTAITSITAKPAGTVVWLRFTGILTVTNGSNLKLNGNFVTAADSMLQLVSDGTNWYEVSRQPTTTTFLGLSDTPSSYSGQANKLVRVNAGETGLEFIIGIPVGLGPLPWPTDTPPSGWLLCDGSAVSRTTYSALFAVIGTTFGPGDGSTTFNLPDMRGRVPLGQDDMGGVSANRVTNAQADIIGGSAGAENHQLTIAEMPSHNHGVQINDATSAGPNRKPETAGIQNTYAWPSDYTGGNQVHNNMQPYLTLNYIIKY